MMQDRLNNVSGPKPRTQGAECRANPGVQLTLVLVALLDLRRYAPAFTRL